MTCRFVSVVSVWGKPEWPMTPIPQVRTSNLQRRLCTRREPVSCASKAATRPFIVGAKLAEAERAGATGALGGASTHTHPPRQEEDRLGKGGVEVAHQPPPPPLPETGINLHHAAGGLSR